MIAYEYTHLSLQLIRDAIVNSHAKGVPVKLQYRKLSRREGNLYPEITVTGTCVADHVWDALMAYQRSIDDGSRPKAWVIPFEAVKPSGTIPTSVAAKLKHCTRITIQKAIAASHINAEKVGKAWMIMDDEAWRKWSKGRQNQQSHRPQIIDLHVDGIPVGRGVRLVLDDPYTPDEAQKNRSLAHYQSALLGREIGKETP